VSLRDEVSAIRRMIDDASMSGAYNVTAPNPVTNREMTEAMSDVVHRPAFAHVPSFVLKSVLGEMSSEVLGSLRVLPTRLLDAGLEFQDPTISEALATAYADRTN
jgi:NAD dependent epimerase/dehydratase family enzyme